MSVEARLEWTSPVARHTDRLILREAALQASGRWAEAGARLAGGEAEVRMAAQAWCQPAGLPTAMVPRGHFRMRGEPVAGRFYPRLAFADLAQGPRDLLPVRVLTVTADTLEVEPNHPLSAWTPELALRPSLLEAAPGARLADLFQGPGLQLPPADPQAAYFSGDALARQDDGDDAAFYAQARLVHHLDAACRAEIAGLHARMLAPGMRVLDLMSSWSTHLPDTPADLFIAGLGMNAAELAANPRLSEWVVKDLNQRAGLPWGDAQFDLALCAASFEYLLQPRMVMREVMRVLRPGGHCVVTFSDRWFPTKAIRLWGELHPFERGAFVLNLFQQAGFTDLHTESLRGLARPADDKYSAQRDYADPLFAVWGRRPA